MIRGRYTPFNLLALNAKLDHGLLLGLDDNDHTQYVNAVEDTATIDLTLTGQSIKGDIILPTTGDFGFWNRTGTTLIPRVAASDAITTTGTVTTGPLLVPLHSLTIGDTVYNVGSILPTGAQSFDIRGNGIYFTPNAGSIISLNPNGVDTDTQIRGASDDYLIYANAGTDRVGIGLLNPSYKLDVDGIINSREQVIAPSGRFVSELIGPGGAVGSFTAFRESVDELHIAAYYADVVQELDGTPYELTLTKLPALTGAYEIEFTTGGNIGTAIYKWRVDAGAWNESVATEWGFFELEGNINIGWKNLGSSEFAIGDEYSFSTNGTPTIALNVNTTSNLTTVYDLLATNTIGASNLTPTRIPYVGASDELIDSANLTFDGTNLTCLGDVGALTLTATSLTETRLVYVGNSDELVDSANLTFDGTNLTTGGLLTINQAADSSGLQINGYDDLSGTGIQLHVAIADTASFDGVSNYLFDGSIGINGDTSLGWKFGSETANILYGQGSATRTRLDLLAPSNDASEIIMFQMTQYSERDDYTNYATLTTRCKKAADAYHEMYTSGSSAANIWPLKIWTANPAGGTNLGQLNINTDGTIDMDTGDLNVTAGNLGVSGVATLSANAKFDTSVDSAAVADEVSLGSYEISAGNRALAISQESAVATEVDETKFSHKLPVRINGSTYYIMLTAT